MSNQWISVKDRLPDKDQTLLVAFTDPEPPPPPDPFEEWWESFGNKTHGGLDYRSVGFTYFHKKDARLIWDAAIASTKKL